jgi:hypothetical protein
MSLSHDVFEQYMVDRTGQRLGEPIQLCPYGVDLCSCESRFLDISHSFHILLVRGVVQYFNWYELLFLMMHNRIIA